MIVLRKSAIIRHAERHMCRKCGLGFPDEVIKPNKRNTI